MSDSESRSKRKRISRACDQCFAKKDKCDGRQPSCSICTRFSRQCSYDRPERKRGPMQGVRQKLESQVQVLEAVLGVILQRHPDLDGIERQLNSESAIKNAARKWRRSELSRGIQGLLAPEMRIKVLQEEESDSHDSADSDTTEIQKAASNADDSKSAIPIASSNRLDMLREASKSPEPQLQRASDPLQCHLLPDSPSSSTSLMDDRNRILERRTRGLVPRGTDPNDALGGFELEFQHLEDLSGVLGTDRKRARDD